MLTDADIERIASRVARSYGPLVVGTFGSYAVGTATDSSDLDLLVIKQTVEQPLARRRAVQGLLFGLLYPIDVQVFTPEEFETAAYEELSFAWMIMQQIRIYHWSEEARQLVPSLLPRVPQYSDAAHSEQQTKASPWTGIT